MILIPVLLLIAGGVMALKAGDGQAKVSADVFTIGSAIVAVGVALLAPGTPVTILRFGEGLTLTFAADTLGRFYIILISAIFAMVQLFAPGYMDHEGKQAQFYAFFQFTFAALLCVSSAANAVTFYMCFELMTLLSMPLVLHNGTEISRSAAFKYLGYSTFGASLALLGFFIAAANLDSLAFTSGGVNITGSLTAVMAAYVLIFIGFGCKAGLVPLQLWLTEAHPVAPSPASAVLSGIITKAGVLGIIRATFFLFGADIIRGTGVQTVLTVLTLVTIFMGSMLASREKVLKRRMAYSTISNVSYVLFGIILLNETAFSGAMLQLVFHALAKDVLFLAAGAIILKTGCTYVDQLKGIGRRMPGTMWCFTLSALSLIGIPPMGGFIAKWYLCLGALEGGRALGAIGVAVLMISALLTAFYLLSITAEAFFPGKDYVSPGKCELSARMLIPLAAMTAIIVILGAFPNGLISFFGSIASAIM